jgi:serine protease Do
MKTKLVLSLLVIIILTTGVVLAQTPTPPPPPPEPGDLVNSFTYFADGGSFLGVYAEDITRENMNRYNLNQVRGVAITRIVKDSPAEKAGLRKDDVILRIDGENVTSVRKLNRLVSEIAPDQSVRVTVSRSGAEQEMTATMGRRSTNADSFKLLQGNMGNLGNWEWEGPSMNADGPWVFALGGSRRIGVNTTELTKQLAEYFGITGGAGVLVTSVAEDGPAAKAGIKAGDVITAVDGEAINSSGDISRVINRKKDGEVTLTLVRNKSQQTMRVTPSERGLSRTVTTPQLGRRIVIPRIEFGTIPDINIALPTINIPTMPPININLPNIKVPKVRVVRGSGGPI